MGEDLIAPDTGRVRTSAAIRFGIPGLCLFTDLLLVKETERIFLILPERWDTLESYALVEVDSRTLVNTGFQPQKLDAVSKCVISEMVQHQLPERHAAKLGAHIHALDLSILRAKQFDTPAAGRCPIIAQQEERHIFRQ